MHVKYMKEKYILYIMYLYKHSCEGDAYPHLTLWILVSHNGILWASPLVGPHTHQPASLMINGPGHSLSSLLWWLGRID